MSSVAKQFSLKKKKKGREVISGFSKMEIPGDLERRGFSGMTHSCLARHSQPRLGLADAFQASEHMLQGPG